MYLSLYIIFYLFVYQNDITLDRYFCDPHIMNIPLLIIKNRYNLHSGSISLPGQRKTINRVCTFIQPLNSHVNSSSLFFLDFSGNTIIYPEKYFSSHVYTKKLFLVVWLLCCCAAILCSCFPLQAIVAAAESCSAWPPRNEREAFYENIP